MKDREPKRFRDRSSSRKGVESQPNLERNQSNLQMQTMKASFRKQPHKELAAMRLADAPRRNHRQSASSHQLSKSYLNSTCDYHGAKTIDDDEKTKVDGITERDPYAQSAFTAERQSYYPPFEKQVRDGEQVKVEFEPTASYLHEVYKFKTAHASVRDKVQSFNEATQFWDAAKYLKNVHRGERPSDKER